MQKNDTISSIRDKIYIHAAFIYSPLDEKTPESFSLYFDNKMPYKNEFGDLKVRKKWFDALHNLRSPNTITRSLIDKKCSKATDIYSLPIWEVLNPKLTTKKQLLKIIQKLPAKYQRIFRLEKRKIRTMKNYKSPWGKKIDIIFRDLSIESLTALIGLLRCESMRPVLSKDIYSIYEKYVYCTFLVIVSNDLFYPYRFSLFNCLKLLTPQNIIKKKESHFHNTSDDSISTHVSLLKVHLWKLTNIELLKCENDVNTFLYWWFQARKEICWLDLMNDQINTEDFFEVKFKGVRWIIENMNKSRALSRQILLE